MQRVVMLLVASVLISVAHAQQTPQNKDFETKFKQLAKNKNNLFKVTAKAGEEVPEATLNLSLGPGATISVSRNSTSVKDMLEEQDFISVVNRNLRTVKYCYCKALQADPDFAGEAIVGMQVKVTGKVKQVSIEPPEVAEHHFGKCLRPRVSKWRFPPFRGKKPDGLSIKSIGYEFPLAFNQTD